MCGGDTLSINLWHFLMKWRYTLAWCRDASLTLLSLAPFRLMVLRRHVTTWLHRQALAHVTVLQTTASQVQHHHRRYSARQKLANSRQRASLHQTHQQAIPKTCYLTTTLLWRHLCIATVAPCSHKLQTVAGVWRDKKVSFELRRPATTCRTAWLTVTYDARVKCDVNASRKKLSTTT